ncbi:MAG: response regulator [Steroidobacter sp.]
MSANLERKIPRRALIVDGDASVRDAAARLLKAAGIDVAGAADGEEGLTLIARQWFPVLVVGRETPVIDGVEFVHRVRAFAVAPVYVIMLTLGSDSQEYESGYCAGVDHFLLKQSYETELVARVTTGLFAIRRRQTTASSRSDGPVIVDLKSGAHTARHLVGRLHAEIALAARQGRPLNVLSVCIASVASAAARIAEANFEAACEALLDAVQDSVRPGLDWIARLPSAPGAYRLAVVMPDSPAVDVSAVEQGIRNVFVRVHEARALQLSMGTAALTDSERKPTALELLGESERRRRGLSAKAQSDIKDVQGDADAAADDAG